MSLIVLRAPASHALHLPWVRATRPLAAGLDLSELFALVPVRGDTADFLAPPSSVGSASTASPTHSRRPARTSAPGSGMPFTGRSPSGRDGHSPPHGRTGPPLSPHRRGSLPGNTRPAATGEAGKGRPSGNPDVAPGSSGKTAELQEEHRQFTGRIRAPCPVRARRGRSGTESVGDESSAGPPTGRSVRRAKRAGRCFALPAAYGLQNDQPS